jgi:hypothetical protein
MVDVHGLHPQNCKLRIEERSLHGKNEGMVSVEAVLWQRSQYITLSGDDAQAAAVGAHPKLMSVFLEDGRRFRILNYGEPVDRIEGEGNLRHCSVTDVQSGHNFLIVASKARSIVARVGSELNLGPEMGEVGVVKEIRALLEIKKGKPIVG